MGYSCRKRTVARPLPRFKGRIWQLAFEALDRAERILFAVDSRMDMITLPSAAACGRPCPEPRPECGLRTR